MATTIKLKKSGEIGNTPSSSELEFGELALNYADGILYYKDPSNVIQQISGSVANTFETINANGTLLIPDSNADILTLLSGDGIDIVGDGLNDTLTINVRFNDTITSNNLLEAATANSVKTAYDLASNTVRVSANGGSTLSGKQLNFVNTGSIFVSVSDAGDGNANVIFTTSGASAGDAYNQANAAYDQANAAYAQANAAYDAANNAKVTIFANNASNVTTQNVNFVNTSTVTVFVTSDGANANIEFTAAPQTVVDDTYTAAGNTAAAATANIANGLFAIATSAYDAANNAAVKVTADSGPTFSANTLSFNNTSTILVTVVQDGSNANISFESGQVEGAYNTSTTAAETVDSWSANTYRSGKYQLQVSSSFGYLGCEIIVIHDGINANLVQYGNVSLVTQSLGTFSTNLSSNLVQLVFTATDSTTRVRYIRSLLKNDPQTDPEILPTDLMTGTNSYDLMEDIYISPTDLN